jgi:hypothetical protein
MCQSGGANQLLRQTGTSGMKVTTLGIDLAKNLFQLHGVNEYGKTVVKKQIRCVAFDKKPLHPDTQTAGITQPVSYPPLTLQALPSL